MPTSKASAKSSSSSSTSKKSATSKAQHRSASNAGPDAIELLTDDHKQVKKLFKAYEQLVKGEADNSEKQSLAEQICTMLTIHATIEEEIFYPAAREALSKQDLIDEAEVEHASAKELIAQIQSMSPEDDLYDAKVTVLGEYIDHHVKEEETEMFPKAKKAKMDIYHLGEELAARKEELMAGAPALPVH